MRGIRIPQSFKEYVLPSESPLRIVNIKEVSSIVIFSFTSIWILYFLLLYFFLIECNCYQVFEFTFITCRRMTIFNVTFTFLSFIIKVTCKVKANMTWTTKTLFPPIISGKNLKPVLFRNIEGKWNTWDWKYIICVFKF